MTDTNDASQRDLFEYTVAQGRSDLFDDEEAFRKGRACPCCDQEVKLYSRKLNSNMARFLCSLVRVYLAQGDERGVHYSKLSYTGRDYSYILLWDLATTDEASEDDAARMSGLWRPTQRGIRFARGQEAVPSHALVYNNARHDFTGDLVGVKTCLGKHFDYKELMGWDEPELALADGEGD